MALINDDSACITKGETCRTHLKNLKEPPMRETVAWYTGKSLLGDRLLFKDLWWEAETPNPTRILLA